MHSDNNQFALKSDISEIKSDLDLFRTQLFSDDITNSKNRLWIFKNKLSDHDTFNDFGYLVSLKISDFDVILKEYESNVANKLLKLVCEYMYSYLRENHLNFEIVRYSGENFLIFLYGLHETEVRSYIENMKQGMSHYKFKHRHKVFNLSFYHAVMQYVKNESFSSVMDQLDEELFINKM